MDKNTINNILRQIVIDTAYERSFQVNSFAVIDNDPEINHESFGKTYSDYQQGSYWSRSWVHGGANRNLMVADFPVLFSESRTANVDLNDINDIEIELYLLLIDKIPCPSCPPDVVRTGEIVSSNALTMIRAVLKELKTYGLHEVEKDGNSSWQWISKGRLDYLISDGWSLLDTSEDIISHLDTKVSIREWGRFSEYRGHYARLTFHLCWPPNINYNYKNKVVNELVSTQCPC